MAMGRTSQNSATNAQLPGEVLEGIYTTMRRIRRFDEYTHQLFEEGLVKGTAHSYVGQEAIAAAVGANLREDDFMASNHRGHGHCIAKGADISLMMVELIGRESGYCGGLGGSMHITDMNLNILGANGIVGAAMLLSTGAGLAAKLQGKGQVVVAFFGDGGSNQGVFKDLMNLAAVWKLPVLFICENNQYALSTSYRHTTSVDQVARWAAGYEIPSVTIDGNNAVEVYLTVREAVERARAGDGPALIEAHSLSLGSALDAGELRDPWPEKEYNDWVKPRDPVKRIEKTISSEKAVPPKRMKEIAANIESELESAIEFGTEGEVRELAFTEALHEAMRQEMAGDDSVFLMGEDVGATGGIFQVSKGLMDEFGEDRVRDTPISEATFVGCGVGAAIAGMRQIVEIQIFDFIALTMDMLVNQAAKFRFMLGGKSKVPLVVRGPQGGGIRMAAQHSQSLEAWFTNVPGLVVVGPSTPYDAKGLLTAAIRDDNPVIFLETKLLYVEGGNGPVPEENYAIPIGKAEVKREGTDVTVVATIAMVPRALSAARTLEREGISVEVINPRTLKPLDEETILNSVRKTNRVLIVHEAWTTGGFGAEVASVIADKGFDWLDAPVKRLGAMDTPMPYNDELERATIPSTDKIAETIRELDAIERGSTQIAPKGLVLRA